MDTSYLKKFYDKSRSERITALQQAGILSEEDAIRLEDGLALSPEIADNMIENQLSTYELPYGVALNFLIDGKDYAVPMAIEEPSVIAAASSAAKIIAQAGGFATVVQNRLMIGQVALKQVPDSALAEQTIRAHEADILKRANEAHPSIVKRGGGARKVSVRIIPADANGANARICRRPSACGDAGGDGSQHHQYDDGRRHPLPGRTDARGSADGHPVQLPDRLSGHRHLPHPGERLGKGGAFRVRKSATD